MKRLWLRYGNWLSNKDKRQIHARSLLEEETNKDFTKATYLALANVMKLLKLE
jgi:hypothetical protein